MNKQKKFESALGNMLDTKPIKNVNKTSNKTKKENKTQKIMKKTKLIFVGILLSLITISCSSNSHDIEEEITTSSLVGKWMFDSFKFENAPEATDDCHNKSYIIFNSDGTFERKDYYTMSGNTCEEDGNDIGTYEYNSTTQKITLYFDDLTAPDDGHQVEVWNNVQLTSSVLSYTWDEDDDGLDEWSITYKK